MPSNRPATGGAPPRLPLHPAARLALRAGIAAGLVMAGLLTVAFIDANIRFARMEAAAPARVFSAPFVLAEGVPLSREELSERLDRLGYRRVAKHPAVPGEYATRFRSFEIHLNAFDYPEERSPEIPVRVRIGFGRVTGVEDARDGATIETARLEPEPIGTLSG
ncbi:MAG: hypothetical protein ACRD5D_09445, partial [Candidatus Polarisedimenticolia bacterium]